MKQLAIGNREIRAITRAARGTLSRTFRLKPERGVRQSKEQIFTIKQLNERLDEFTR